MSVCRLDKSHIAGLPAVTLVKVVPEGEAPFVARWDEFVRDNQDDDTIDWCAMARTIMVGRTWNGGGGAEPVWSVVLA